MDHFNYRDNELYAEDVQVADIAKQFGTPCYIYSRATLTRHWQAFDSALGDHPHLICFAVKACSNIAVLQVLAQLGSGFDIVSIGELERVLAAGGDPAKVVFSGVAKQAHEIKRALELGIHCLNVESHPELELINEVAKAIDIKAPVSIRINPDIDAKTHPYISTGLKENKFGVDFNDIDKIYSRAQALSHVEPVGIDCHIGSQLTELEPFTDALDKLLGAIDKLHEQGIKLDHIDLGGGLGVKYENEEPPHPSDYSKAILAKLQQRALKVILEPGRAIAANAGIFISQVLFVKETTAKNFLVVDGGMNDFLRPSLYSAWHEIINTQQRPDETKMYDVVGPVCETGDFFARDRELQATVHDIIAVRGAGAYGFAMSSNYNSRPRPAEVLVDGTSIHLIRERESINQLFATEHLIQE